MFKFKEGELVRIKFIERYNPKIYKEGQKVTIYSKRFDDFDKLMFGEPIYWFGKKKLWCSSGLRESQLELIESEEK